MRSVVPLLVLIFVFGNCQAGLVQRHVRDIPEETPIILSQPLASDLKKDQIPVTVIQDGPIPELPNQAIQKTESPAQAAEEVQNLRIGASQEEAKGEEIQEMASVPNENTPDEEVKPALQEEKQEEEVEAVAVEAASEDNSKVEAEPEAAQADENVEPQQLSEDPEQHMRQVTQATPSDSSTTQTNFVQQFIQNSPIGQFFNQLTGQPIQQQPANDEIATPAPTLPGFLNPQNAITSAQQAVQNVVNSTTQAFQGLQQFASNLGTQFQNTLSSLGGQQIQLSATGSTTARPPGPIQTVINNFIGNNNQTAANPQPNPLQGIISFFQGGNRPNNGADPAAAAPPSSTSKPNELDDKVDISDNEIEEQQRDSQEAIDDSFEEGHPGEDIIVVNDDASADVPEVEHQIV